MSKHLSLLLRFQTRLYQLLISKEEVAIKRARSDADLVLLVSELALSLPIEEQMIVRTIVARHNQLWGASSDVSWIVDTQEGLQSVMDAYRMRAAQAPIGSAEYIACGTIAKSFGRYVKLASAVECVQSALKEIEMGLRWRDTEERKVSLLRKKAIYEEFLSTYAE